MQPDVQPEAELPESSAPSAPAETADAEMSQAAIDLPVNVPVPMEEDDLHVHAKPLTSHQVFELSVDVHPEDITDNPLCLWSVLEDCFAVSIPKAKQRRVEVSFRKLSEGDKLLFEKAMQKEWNSWIENKVVSICRSKGIPVERVIKARWVLTWKASSDPDVKDRTPKARLVLVGWQDPDLGKIATDSPTLRKETKHLILSLCAARKWKLWGADIKTAFLSGDPSLREIYFRPPAEVKDWMKLSDQELFRLEKAAYGLAEAPKACYLRLPRELSEVGQLPSFRFAMAAPPAKRASVLSNEPLTESEISMTTGLLHRAIQNGQQQLMIQHYRQSRAGKWTHVPHKAVIDECSAAHEEVNHGAMSDATKRQRDAEEPEDDVHDWDRISMAESQLSSYTSYAAAGKGSAPSAPYPSAQQEPVRPGIQVPEGITVAQWGMSLCKMDKVKEWNSKGVPYSRLVQWAEYRTDVCKYLSWIKSTFGTQGTGMPKKKITSAVDLANYLEYTKWEPAGSDSVPFVREFAEF
eukprot:s905_g4.t1